MMDNTIIDNINANVGEEDTLWHLGDFCFAPRNRYYAVVRDYRSRINCRNIYQVWGNHDNESVAGVFKENHWKVMIKERGQSIVLCHEAFAIWTDSHKGAWNLYGHSHSGAENWLDEILPGRKSMDVGVDNAYKLLGEFRPFSFDDIHQIMSRRPGHNKIKKDG